MLKLRILVVGVMLLSAYVAGADETNPLLGKWEEKRPNGSKMVWEFTATTIAFSPVDASGKQTRSGNKAEISYRKLDRSYAIEFKNENGKPGGGIMAIVKDENTMVLDFPGAGAHTLIRVRP